MKLPLRILLLFTTLHFSTGAQTVHPVRKRADIDATMKLQQVYTSYNGKLYFAQSNKLYVTDGTAQGTTLVKTLYTSVYIEKLAVVNNRMIFAADDGTHNRELWVSDGTDQGTQLLLDINPGGDGVVEQFTDNPDHIFPVVNGAAYFYGDDNTNGIQLWKTDGTVQGTKMVKTINGNIGIASPQDEKHMIVFGNNLYFQAREAATGDEMWVSDGTDAGTKLFADIVPGAEGSFAGGFVAADNKLFFHAGEKSGQHLVISIYTTNGSNGTYSKVLNDAFIEMSHEHASHNGKTLLRIRAGATTSCIMVTDGTQANTDTIMTDIRGGQLYHGNDVWLTELNGKFYITASIRGMTHNAIWESDGTRNGTAMIYKAIPSYPFTHLVRFGNKLYYNAFDTTTKMIDLWQSDGTATGAKKTQYTNADAPPITSILLVNGWLGRNLMVHGTEMYFLGHYNKDGDELCKISMWPDNIPGIENNKDISIYPNPTDNEFTIKGDNIKRITITNISGITIYSSAINEPQQQVDTRNWIPGMYIATIDTGNGEVLYRKIVKE